MASSATPVLSGLVNLTDVDVDVISYPRRVSASWALSEVS